MAAESAPRRIGITGAAGMLGWHLRCRLLAAPGFEAVLADRETFADQDALDAFVSACDVIVHLAGVNRANDQEDVDRNPAIAQQLVDALQGTGARPALHYSSSTHARGDSPYGRAKREAGRLLSAWAQAAGAAYTEWVLPHVFGECGRPFYNSVVHTFCHQLAEGAAPEIRRDGELELLHAGTVTALLLDAIRAGSPPGERAPGGTPLSVGALWDQLQELHSVYHGRGQVPELREPLTRALFNVYRSYLFPRHYPVALELHEDPRGSLFEAVRSHNGGQTFLSTTRPGITRGNHFHFSKVERFLVVQGQAEIRVRRLFEQTVHRFAVDGATPVFIDMPTLHTHDITNVGDGELLTLFWADEIFDPQQPDTFAEPVLPSATTARQA